MSWSLHFFCAQLPIPCITRALAHGMHAHPCSAPKPRLPPCSARLPSAHTCTGVSNGTVPCLRRLPSKRTGKACRQPTATLQHSRPRLAGVIAVTLQMAARSGGASRPAPAELSDAEASASAPHGRASQCDGEVALRLAGGRQIECGAWGGGGQGGKRVVRPACWQSEAPAAQRMLVRGRW